MCKKKIKDRPILILGIESLKEIELCRDCATPILRFLKKHKLIKSEKKKINK